MASKNNFVDRLTRGTLLSDGAFGTELYTRGEQEIATPLVRANTTQPALVKAIHLDYLRAGAEILTTNTYGASAPRLGLHGLEDEFEEINQAGVRIAHEARRLSGQHAWIAGSISPLSREQDLFGSATNLAASASAFADQAKLLAEAGVDLLILETFAALPETLKAIEAIRDVTDLPIVAQMTFAESGLTPAGESPEEVAKALDAAQVAALGANCSVGPGPLFDVLELMAPVTTRPIIVQPNAGYPTYQDGRLTYGTSPSYMGEMAGKMIEGGALIVGGCCGTTPEHIEKVRDTIGTVRSQPAPHSVPFAATVVNPSEPTPTPERTNLAQRLRQGRFVVTMEVSPPRGFDMAQTLDGLRPVANVVDAFNVTDSPRAQGRMSALAAAGLIQSRIGVETVLHVAVRHRNLLALHADLLGAHAMGVRNIFVVMGDPASTGDYPQATAVADVTASGLIGLMHGFNQGMNANGNPMEQATAFLVGCAVNLNARDLEAEGRILERKVKAGADFLITQPVYDPERVERFRSLLGGFPVPMLAGILPLRSVRHAQFLDNEVPGIQIPPDLIERLSTAGEEAAQVGIEVARQVLRDLQGTIAGAYFIPAFGQYEVVTETLEGIIER